MHSLNKIKSKLKIQAPPSSNFLSSIFSVKSEILPQIHALFFEGFELRNEVSDLEISVTMEPGLLSDRSSYLTLRKWYDLKRNASLKITALIQSMGSWGLPNLAARVAATI